MSHPQSAPPCGRPRDSLRDSTSLEGKSCPSGVREASEGILGLLVGGNSTQINEEGTYRHPRRNFTGAEHPTCLGEMSHPVA